MIKASSETLNIIFEENQSVYSCINLSNYRENKIGSGNYFCIFNMKFVRNP